MVEATSNSGEQGAVRAAVLGLWSVPGVGPKALSRFEQSVPLAQVASLRPEEWVDAVPSTSASLRAALVEGPTLAERAESLRTRCARTGTRICYRSDLEYPIRLGEIADAPPLLFFVGAAKASPRQLAMVGSRHPDGGFEPRAKRWAQWVVGLGMGVVSGAAEGVDRACHLGALEAGGSTWAFLGSALDTLDLAHRRLLERFLEGSGTFYTELCPGTQPSRATFPRRNRLISGASDAVLVLRAGSGSGTLHTARFAREQGRPLLALPGDAENEAARGANELIRSGEAGLCLEPADLVQAVGLEGRAPGAAAEQGATPRDLSVLSAAAQQAYQALSARASGFEELQATSRLPSGELATALSELELEGFVVQRPGRRYERI